MALPLTMEFCVERLTDFEREHLILLICHPILAVMPFPQIKRTLAPLGKLCLACKTRMC